MLKKFLVLLFMVFNIFAAEHIEEALDLRNCADNIINRALELNEKEKILIMNRQKIV